MVAIGEIGLDFFRNLSPPRRPGADVPLACSTSPAGSAKPAVIHCRDAHAETLAILEDERVGEVGGDHALLLR